jgi:hypothetical protein
MVRKLFSRWILVAALGAASFQCSPQEEPSADGACKSDSDCDHSEYCDNGQCRKRGR